MLLVCEAAVIIKRVLYESLVMPSVVDGVVGLRAVVRRERERVEQGRRTAGRGVDSKPRTNRCTDTSVSSAPRPVSVEGIAARHGQSRSLSNFPLRITLTTIRALRHLYRD
jgi:hypothetical protein